MARKAGWEAGDEIRQTLAGPASSGPAEAEINRYIQHLEGLFLELRGRGVQWSPEDSARASTWYRAGLPLASVIGAIEGRVRTFRYLNGKDASLPSHLAWYEPTVTKTRGRLRLPAPAATTRLTGPVANDEEDVPTGPTVALLALMDAVPDMIEDASDPALAEAYRRALRALRRLGDHAITDAAGLDAAAFEAGLKRCRATLVRTMMTGIGPAAAAEVQAEVDISLTREGAARGSKKAREARTRVLLERALGQSYGLKMATAEGWRSPRGERTTEGAA